MFVVVGFVVVVVVMIFFGIICLFLYFLFGWFVEFEGYFGFVDWIFKVKECVL